MARSTKPRDLDRSWENPLNIIRDLRLAWRLLQDQRVPIVTKLIPAVVVVYIISPIDLIPEFFLGLGQLDDLAVFLLGVKAFVSFAPATIVAQHIRNLGARLRADQPEDDESDYVNAEYRVLRDDE